MHVTGNIQDGRSITGQLRPGRHAGQTDARDLRQNGREPRRSSDQGGVHQGLSCRRVPLPDVDSRLQRISNVNRFIQASGDVDYSCITCQGARARAEIQAGYLSAVYCKTVHEYICRNFYFIHRVSELSMGRVDP